MTPSRMRLELERAATASGIVLDARVLDGCATHYQLLLRWNETHNLTRITREAEAARKHYLDCLIPLLAKGAPAAFVDVGSGAGFPGLMAALVWPDARALLVERARKRKSFLELAALAMGVHVAVVGEARGPLVISRATFAGTARRQLCEFLETGEGNEIWVWGHRHDAVTWEAEVATWPGFEAELRDYHVGGLEPRAILVARRVRNLGGSHGMGKG